MSRLLRTVLAAGAVCISGLLASCDHKDLCYDHNHPVRARIEVDWSQFTEEVPTGMTVSLFSQDDGSVHTQLSNNTSYVDVNVSPGFYRAFVFNQSTTEFGSLTFERMDDMFDATVRAADRASRWFKARDANERLVQNPEWFAVGVQSNIDVPKAAAALRHNRADSRSVIAKFTPLCVVYTIHVRIHVRNIYNLRSARASLDGLADGYRIGIMEPTSTLATQLLENWTIEHDSDNPANGTIRADITSFGLPYGHQNIPAANHLLLSVLLVDNKTTLSYDFPVGNAFRTDQGLSLSLSIDQAIDAPLPDVKPEGGQSGGFDAKVDDWGDEVNIDIGV